MNSRQETKLVMYFSVREYVTDYLKDLSTLPNFQTSFELFQNTMDQIQNASEQQILNRTGNALTKKQYRKALIILAADTARKIKAYAMFNNDVVLQHEMNVTQSALQNMADNRMNAVSQAIYERAQALVDHLSQYDVTSESQAALQLAIANFSQSISMPRIGTVESGTATMQLVRLFKVADDSLRNMDASMEIIRIKQPELYGGYKSGRRLITRGRRTLALKGSVVDASDGAGLRGVKITFVLQDKGANVSFVKKSFSQGGFYVRLAKEGVYDVVAEFPGYQKAVAKVSLVSGEMSVLKIVMEKV